MSPPAYGNVRLRLGRFWRWYQRALWSGLIARRLSALMRELRPSLVWLMADFSLVPVGLRLWPMLRGQRVHVSIHDDLLATAQREQCSKAFLSEVKAFLSVLSVSDCSADTVSEELLEEVVPRARQKAVVTLAVDPAACVAGLRGPSERGTFIVGFSGNFYGESEVACFVEGLNLWSERCGRDWRLRVFGSEALGKLDARIEARGFTPIEQVRAELTDCDLLLLPSPLERPEMRTNMPTKLVTYLEAGRLIFAFAPKQSATERVITGSGIGCVQHSQDPEAVARGLAELCTQDITVARNGWQCLIENRFSEQRILRDLTAALAD